MHEHYYYLIICFVIISVLDGLNNIKTVCLLFYSILTRHTIIFKLYLKRFLYCLFYSVQRYILFDRIPYEFKKIERLLQRFF